VPDSNNTNGRKPYTTYTSGRARRSSLDSELAASPASRFIPPDDTFAQQLLRPGGGERSVSAAHASAAAATAAPAYRTYTSRNAHAGDKAKPARRRRRRWIPLTLLLLLVVGLVAAAAVVYPGYRTLATAVAGSNRRIDSATRAQLTPDAGAIWRNGTTVLLLGVDSKAGEPARSDTIMLMRFNPSKHTVNQLSIARDSRVPLPSGTLDKINAAMFWGGPAMAVQTVKDYTGINVNHIMIVNFQGFPRLVNAVGGVDINAPKTITTVAGSTGREVVFKKGMNHLDGKYAMLYVRARYVDDDFHRAERQQQVVQALEKKLTQPSIIPQLPEVGKRFMSGVSTDLTTTELAQLAYVKWRAKSTKHLVLGGTPGWEGGVSYVFPPSDAEKQKLVDEFLSR
jgi:LCP family protein required for cell wall assembly